MSEPIRNPFAETEFFGLPKGEMTVLRRDAERFRKLEAKHAEDSDSGAWCEVDLGDFDPIRLPLAEIADALPGLTDTNRQNDR